MWEKRSGEKRGWVFVGRVFFIWGGTTGPAVGGGRAESLHKTRTSTPLGGAHTDTHTHARAQKRGGKKKGGEGSGDKISPGRPVRRIRGGGSARAQLELVQARRRRGGWERRRKQKGRARTRTRGEGRECFENWRRTQHPRRARKRRGKSPAGRTHAPSPGFLAPGWEGRTLRALTHTHTHTAKKGTWAAKMDGWTKKRGGRAGGVGCARHQKSRGTCPGSRSSSGSPSACSRARTHKPRPPRPYIQ